MIPPGETFILVNDDQWGNEARAFPGHRVLPFTEREGGYWGPPADDPTAVSELDRLIDAGATHIVFTWSSFWWLNQYPGLNRDLRKRFRCLAENELLIAFDLRRPMDKRPVSG